MAAAPLTLFWWNETPNFGDRIAQDIVARVSGRDVAWASPAECELFAIGSILKMVRTGLRDGAAGRRPFVWGSGLMGPLRMDFLREIRVAALRGPITAALLNAGKVPFGDPGLLVSDIVEKPVYRDGAVAIVAHHSMNADRLAITAGRRPVRMIDVRKDDHLDVVRDIAGCDYVLSSSLHGLIVADAFGIPNTWIDPTGIHRNAPLKFHDYALSIDRLMGPAVDPGGVSAHLADLPDDLPPPAYLASVAAAKVAVRAAFPDALRA